MFSVSYVHSEGSVVNSIFTHLSENGILVDSIFVLDILSFCDDNSPLYDGEEMRSCVEGLMYGDHIWLECSLEKTSIGLLVKIKTDPFTINDPVPAGYDYPHENNA